jgi:hypothetical protein
MGLFLEEPSAARGLGHPPLRLYKARRFCSSTPTLFNSGTLHSQLSSCYLYKVDDSIESIMVRGIAENAFLSKWAGGLGGSWTRCAAPAATSGHQRRKPGRDPLPQAAQRPAGGRQPGRQAPRLRLRLPRDLAQRHLRLPRAAAQHRRRPPPHPRHEHRQLDPGPVHEADGGAPALDAVPSNEVPDLHELYGKAFEDPLPRLRGRLAPRRDLGPRGPAIDLWKRCSRCCSRPGTRGSPSRIPATCAARRTTPASSTARTCAPRSPSTPARTRPRSATSARWCSTTTCATTARSTMTSCARRSGRRARARQRDRHQLLPDRGRPPLQPAPPPGRARRDGPAKRALPPRRILRQRRGGRVQRRVHGGGRLLRLRGLQRPRRRARYLRKLQGIQVGPRPAAAGHPRPARAGARRAVEVPRGGRMDWPRCARRSAARACATRTCWRSPRPPPSPTSWAPPPASSRRTRTSSSRATCPASSSCSTPSWCATSSAAGCGTDDMLDQLKYFDGELGKIPGIPADLKRKLPDRVRDRPRTT